MKTKTKTKTYDIKEVAEMLGVSKQRITQKINGYVKKAKRRSGNFYMYQYAPKLAEKIDYFYDRTRIRITAAGLKKLKKVS